VQLNIYACELIYYFRETFHSEWIINFLGIKIKGEAEAFAIEAKGKAEAEQLTKKAEAYKTYKDAALVEMLLEALPKV